MKVAAWAGVVVSAIPRAVSGAAARRFRLASIGVPSVYGLVVHDTFKLLLQGIFSGATQIFLRLILKNPLVFRV